MRYWDSSAIVPLLVTEPLTKSATASFKEDPEIITWWATAVECISALARLEREHHLSAAAMTQSLKRLAVLRGQWIEVEPSNQVRELSLRLLRVHRLRAADSLQLAAALTIAQNVVPGMIFVCCDDRLQLAAEKELLDVLRLG